MSTKLTGYVWDACAASGMKLSSVAIMARLADFSSDEGVSWPSIATIARQIGAGESTVRTAISQLEKDGWLTRQQRRKGNRNASNVYQLNVAKLQAAAFLTCQILTHENLMPQKPTRQNLRHQKTMKKAVFTRQNLGGIRQ